MEGGGYGGEGSGSGVERIWRGYGADLGPISAPCRKGTKNVP